MFDTEICIPQCTISMHVHRYKVKRMEKNQSFPGGLACKACNLPPPARWESLTGSCSHFQDLQTVGIYEKKTKHFWRSRRTRKCFSTITTKSRMIQTDESSTPQNTEVCTKKMNANTHKNQRCSASLLGKFGSMDAPFCPYEFRQN